MNPAGKIVKKTAIAEDRSDNTILFPQLMKELQREPMKLKAAHRAVMRDVFFIDGVTSTKYDPEQKTNISAV